MGLFTRIVDPYDTMGVAWSEKPKAEQQADLNRVKAARAAANTGTRKFGFFNQSPTSQELNDLVIEAEKHVPWWRR